MSYSLDASRFVHSSAMEEIAREKESLKQKFEEETEIALSNVVKNVESRISMEEEAAREVLNDVKKKNKDMDKSSSIGKANIVMTKRKKQELERQRKVEKVELLPYKGEFTRVGRDGTGIL